MSTSLLPLRPSPDPTDHSRRAVDLADEATGALLSALQSETARRIVGAIAEEPATATDLAGLTGTSPQNVHHHLDRLADAGLVEQVDTWYSSRGIEMAVYDLATHSLAIDLTSASDRPAAREGRR